MDHTTLRTIITLVSFAAFAAVVAWAMSGRNRQRFDEAAQLPFADDDLAPPQAKEKP